MQSTSEIYQALLAEPQTFFETKVLIAGEEYLSDRLVSVRTSGSLFSDDTFSIGGTCSREIEIELIRPGAIPRMAELRPFVRLSNSVEQSEWIPKGVFYIDTRSVDTQSGRMSITGYDAMLKGEQNYITADYQGTWPKTDLETVKEICDRIGVELDDRTETLLTMGVQVQYPGYGDGAYTVREVLGYIGAMYAGNWFISDEGKLYLASMMEFPTETSYLINQRGDALLLGGVRLLV